MKEYYTLLYLKDGASEDEVKDAYRKLVKKFHPDKNNGSDEFRLIQGAYEKLISSFAGRQIGNKENPSETTEGKADKNHNTENPNETTEDDIEGNVGFFSYKVNGFSCSKAVGKGFAKQIADGIYLVIQLSFTNITKKTELIEDSMFKLIDEENYQFETSINGTNGLLMSGAKTFGIYANDCHPNIPINGCIVFEVPRITKYSLILSSAWQTKIIPLLDIKILSDADGQNDKVKEVIKETYQEKSIVNIASTQPETGLTKFNCGICKEAFYADRIKDDLVICPHCKAKNTILKINIASMQPRKGLTKFNCGICKEPFYADRIKNESVSCPYCKAKNTLPEVKKVNASVIVIILVIISLLLVTLFMIF